MNSQGLAYAIGWALLLATMPVRCLTAQEITDEQRTNLHREIRSAMTSGNYANAASALDELVKVDPDNVDYHFTRGTACFMNGDMSEAVSSYDRAIELEPDQSPRCWQRGLALYYADQFKLGQEQFEAHQTYNRNDVENAVWHMLCVARQVGVDEARAKLIPISGDGRVPMAEIYQLFAGTGTVDDVMQAASTDDETDSRYRRQMYYACLYVGLYHEMTGDNQQALAAMKRAADLNPIEKGQLMGSVADVHLLLRSTQEDE
ncbi:MAG: tetratricopeptide repeat protein [Pirellulaceae bacterium]